MSLMFFIAPYKKIVPPAPIMTSLSILNLSLKPVSSSSAAAEAATLLLLLLYQMSLYPIQLVLKYLYGNFQHS
jgi:hypothetical protein